MTGGSDRNLSRKRETWRVGTWNVRGIQDKDEELQGEFEMAGLDILIVTETKRKDKTVKETSNRHVIICSGVGKEERAKQGVACMIHRKHADRIEEWKAVNGRIVTATLKSKERDKKLTIIGVYGPNDDDTKENNDRFWEQLTQETEEAKGELLVMGDFNSRVGRNVNRDGGIIGPYGEESRNGNGRRMIDYCREQDLIIANTHFQIHKYTREQKSKNERSLIDYVFK